MISYIPLLLSAGGLYAVFYLVTSISTYITRRRFKHAHGCKPVRWYPHKDPFLGSDLLMKNVQAGKEHKVLEVAQKRFFDEMKINTFKARLVRQDMINTIEPENVKTVLSLKFKDFGLGHRIKWMGPLLGHGIFTTDGEHWAHSRAMVRPNFVKEQVADIKAFERHVSDLFALIPRDGSTVDLQDLFFRFTIDSSTEFLFGKGTDELKAALRGDNNEGSFAWAFNYSQNSVMYRFRIGAFNKILKDPYPQELQCRKIVHDLVDQFVDNAVEYRRTHDVEKAQPEEKYVFLRELTKQTTDKRRLRDETLNILLAGRDTTAGLLSNMFWFIAKEPRIWQRMRQEVEDALHGELPTYQQLRDLKYVKWCINESLRLHPLVPMNSRIAIRDTVIPLGGGPDDKSPVFVPKGTTVNYNTWTMHRRKDLYGPDAEEFKPERWEHLRPGWEYLPFNGGPRICLGQQYALTEASYITVRILQEFKDIESRDPGPWEENYSLTLASRNGTKVSLTPA